MKKFVVEKMGFDSMDNNMINSSILLPLLQIVFKRSSATCMERLRSALRRGKIDFEEIGGKHFPTPKSFLLWLCEECKKQLK